MLSQCTTKRAVLGTRQFHSTASFTFLFRRPPPPDSVKVLRDMLQAKDNDRLDLVAKLYPSLVTATTSETASTTSRASSAPNKPSHGRLQIIMRFVASTNRFKLLLRMFNDLSTVFGYNHNALDHHILLLGMTRAGKPDKALQWIESMSATHGIAPSTSDWNVVLGGYRAQRDLTGIRTVLDRMQKSGYSPNVVTYNSLISALFELGHLDQVRDAINDMQQRGLKPDLWTDTALLTGFTDAGELASAREVHERVTAAVEQQQNEIARKDDTAAVNALIKFETVQHGFEAGLTLARKYRDRGFSLDAWTMNTLAIEAASKIEDATGAVQLIERLEDACELEADRRTWSAVLSGVLAGPGGITEALKVHQEARDRSVEPDSTMVQPLLSTLLLPSPTPDSLAIAKSLYEDLSQASRAYHASPDISIYVTLLRACADPAHPDLEYSRTLIADMRDRGLRFDGPSLTWHIVALMRAAINYEQAFQAYDQMRALDPTVLETTAAYNTILAAFTSLSFRDEPNPPTAMIGEILSDMRHSSPPAPPNSNTYAQLLSYYSKVASGNAIDASASQAAAKQIAHLHSLIKLDSNLDPDTALFNALMSAYSRIGAHAAAERIWDTLRANGQSRRGTNVATTAATAAGPKVNTRSVSIVLDACGFAGEQRGYDVDDQVASVSKARALARARQIWSDLEDGSLVVVNDDHVGPGVGAGADGGGRNLKNWESYVECLCRLDEFDEAERIVFVDMRQPNSGVQIQVSTIETLLKFVRRAPDGDLRWERIRSRVRDEFKGSGQDGGNGMWDQVKDVAKTRSWQP